MKLLQTLMLACSTFAASSVALQSIYVGYRSSGNTDKCGSQFAWFSDADPCTTGVDHGHYYCFNNDGFCSANPYTILGHTGISFIGCPTTGSHFPTGVLDAPNTNRNSPNLRCTAAGADGPLGSDLAKVAISCPANSRPGTPYGFTVYAARYCK